MSNIDLMHKFYGSFSNSDADGMIACYDDNITFKDPAFGELKGERAKAMWQMLLAKKTDAKIKYEILQVSKDSACVEWIANYTYGPEKRNVTNHVHAYFKIENNKITKHRDSFCIWKWSQQALGTSGYLFGWSALMKNKIQNKTNKLLNDYMSKHEPVAAKV